MGKGIKKSDGTTADVVLGRYVFADGTNHKSENGNILAKGTPMLKQSAENYLDETEINIKEIVPTTSANYAFKELATSRTGISSNGLDGSNTTALNLKGFIDSTQKNGGYYIARYEASYGTDGKVNSKVSNSVGATAEGGLWNWIIQIDAATASRNLYTTINSDLINSYAWDTAIVYIQEFSGNTDYSRQNSKNLILENTGVNGDEVCKINDMSANEYEWTTEYSTYILNSSSVPCTIRGGDYYNNHNYMSYRYADYTTVSYVGFTFRAVLYM